MSQLSFVAFASIQKRGARIFTWEQNSTAAEQVGYGRAPQTVATQVKSLVTLWELFETLRKLSGCFRGIWPNKMQEMSQALDNSASYSSRILISQLKWKPSERYLKDTKKFPSNQKL